MAGKSLFLFYLLARRLLAQKPTIFQRDANSIYFFSATGVRRLSHDIIHPSVKSSETLALINARQDYKTAPIFLRDDSDLFLVVALSPLRHAYWRLKDVEHYRFRVVKWFMEPFGLEELIQAQVFLITLCCDEVQRVLAVISSELNAVRHQSSSFCRNMARLLVTAMQCARTFQVVITKTTYITG